MSTGKMVEEGRGGKKRRGGTRGQGGRWEVRIPRTVSQEISDPRSNGGGDEGPSSELGPFSNTIGREKKKRRTRDNNQRGGTRFREGNFQFRNPGEYREKKESQTRCFQKREKKDQESIVKRTGL